MNLEKQIESLTQSIEVLEKKLNDAKEVYDSTLCELSTKKSQLIQYQRILIEEINKKA